MLSPDRIKHFVQNILGCGCPEEVFRSIDVRRNLRLNPGASEPPAANRGVSERSG